jgi:hypothetical protein
MKTVSIIAFVVLGLFASACTTTQTCQRSQPDWIARDIGHGHMAR